MVGVRHPAPAPLVVQVHTSLRLGLHLTSRAVNKGEIFTVPRDGENGPN